MRSFMMKKLFSTLLCLSLLVLCACGEVGSEEITAENETAAGAANEQKTEAQAVTESTTKVKIKTDPDDPYSFVVADVVEGGIDWPLLGNAFIDRREDYVLYDTDSNGTYALLIGGKNSYGEVHEIYTIEDGVVERKLSIYDDTGRRVMIMWKTGIISAGQTDGGGASGYYRFDEDGQLKLIVGLGLYVDGSGFRIDPTGTEKDFFFNYIPDGTEVRISTDEYWRLKNDLLGDREKVELDWKPMAEYEQ